MHKFLMVTICILVVSGLILGCKPAVTSTPEPVQAEESAPAAVLDTPSASPATNSIPLILSHDGAPDDIAALVYIARHPAINLLGVVNSYGEQHPSRSLAAWQEVSEERMTLLQSQLTIFDTALVSAVLNLNADGSIVADVV